MVHSARCENIAILTIDNPPVNALGLPVLRALSDAMDAAITDAEIRAVVLTGSGRLFCGGGEISEVQKLIAGAPGSEMEFTRQLFLRIEDSPLPIVAALNGSCIGGGLEMAMACHYRVALPALQLGLPEVKLGIIPGAGGALRLPRLAGIAKSIELCTTGKSIKSVEALEIGIIDKMIEGDLLTGAVAFARTVIGKPLIKTREREDKLGSHEENALLFDSARATLRRQQEPLLAPLLVIDVIEAATRITFSESYQFESEASNKCLVSPQARALMHVYLSEREVRNVPDLPAETPTLPIRSVAVVGAGVMGGGIAMVFANAGIPVLLKDIDEAALGRGMTAIRKFYAGSVQKGRLSQDAMNERVALIKPTLEWNDLAQADMVVEAVFENLAVKQRVFAELDRVCKPDAILASNTSTLNIDAIAAATARPASVIGTHFFIPPPVMRLLEIVRGKATSNTVIATCMQLATRLGKLGVLVGNCRGFVANRMAERYRIQASFLVEEGAPVEAVDKALMDFGMGIGPLAVGDVAGLDIIWAGRIGVREAEIAAGVRQPIEDRLCDLKRFGRRTGAGWYKYGEDRHRAIADPELDVLIRQWAAESGIAQRQISKEEVVERCIYMLINEGARILEEGIALRASDIDAVYVNGYGFPAWRGGPMHYADATGLKLIYDRICEFHRQHGQVWEPAPLLRRLAESGGRFSTM